MLFGLLAAGGIALLSGCTGPGGAPAPVSSTASATPGGSTPTAGAAASVSSPKECDNVDLIADAKISGADLSACVIAFSRAAGSGHEYLQAGDASGEVDFVFGEAPAMSGTITGPDGPRSFILTKDDAWVTFDGAWVRGDSASSDSRAVIAGTVGQAFRSYADPSVAAGFIASAPSWTVQPGREAVTFPDGSTVSAWRVQVDAPFSANGATVNDMVIWLGDGHRVIGNQATVDVGGTSTTTLQQYTRWGEPVTITPPQG